MTEGRGIAIVGRAEIVFIFLRVRKSKMSEHEELKHEGLFDGGDTTVTLTLDDGSTMECVVLTIFEAGNEGKEYIALSAGERQRD